MNRQRLAELSSHLRKLKLSSQVEFDMSHWGHIEETNKVESKIKVKDGKACKVEEGFCKTSACVLGHAALKDSFSAAGLKINFNADALVTNGSAGGTIQYKAGGHTYEDMDAGKKFFNLSDDQAECLFLGPWKSPKEAANFIDNLLAGKVDKDDLYDNLVEKYGQRRFK